MLWVTLADVWQIRDGKVKYLYETKEKVSELGLANSSARLLPKNTVVLSRTASVGFSAIMGVDMATTQDFANWICGPEVLPEFLLHVFRAMHGEFHRLMMGSTHNTIYMPDIQSLRFAQPPVAEQSLIAEFLDRETAKIDGLVEEQQRLIELLIEKRQAVISDAVTKGLNPHTPMKPSGVEWLGDVPEHWETCLLKRAFSSVDYGISDSLEAEGAIAILRMGNIENGKIVTDDLKYIDSVDPLLLLQRGDLLYNRTNSLDLIGKVGMFQGDSDSPMSFASYLVRLRTLTEYIPSYFAYLLNTEGVLGLARASAFVAIGQCNLNPTRYGQITIAIPPGEEQASIVAYLDNETAKLDALTAEAEHAIDLLQERRASLISAAVTGKIDVREAQTVTA